MKEIWKPIKGYEKLYEVSNLGRIKSLAGKIDGNRGVRNYDKILGGTKEFYGYKVVSLCKNGYKNIKVHRLVAEAFIPNPLGLPEINHKDCNKTNNHINNLEWVTHRQNTKHAMDNNLFKRRFGEDNKKAILSNFDAMIIREFYRMGKKQSEISKLYNISPMTVHKIVRNITYPLNS